MIMHARVASLLNAHLPGATVGKLTPATCSGWLSASHLHHSDVIHVLIHVACVSKESLAASCRDRVAVVGWCNIFGRTPVLGCFQ